MRGINIDSVRGTNYRWVSHAENGVVKRERVLDYTERLRAGIDAERNGLDDMAVIYNGAPSAGRGSGGDFDGEVGERDGRADVSTGAGGAGRPK